ncbi:class I SAM-dependent methyltransferase [Variovorax sp. EL159]|uniref:class I SAM-dependent methyltransferase n=1 Tax=Variovorax sp. EL159 TaxID=1566270 RepID=UPI000888B404|nr:class I SAM-dependent methyltransferase [Variovorax sp. EL159]SCX48479.1 Methyltransferase domain-containing protein [Variovorax sp. EL159]
MSAVMSSASTDTAWRELHEAATVPYKKGGSFAWHFARGKLGRDPVFRGLLERGLVGAQHQRVVDIGCGQGLFASLLASMSAMQKKGRWPSSWSTTPAAADYTGIELMPKDVARAQASIGHLQPTPQLVCGDMCSAALPDCDLVVILDVLHYVDLEAQEGVLQRVRSALAGGGNPQARLLLRVGDASSRRGFAISQWVDRTVTRIRGHKVSPTWGRPLADWKALLQRLGFRVQSIPMSEGTPFANVLLVADLEAAA